MLRAIALRAVFATIALCATASSSQATLVFNFEFDGSPDGTVTPPILGTGTLTLNADPGTGIFSLEPFAPTMSFSFVTGASFTHADLFTPLANILISIVDLGGGLRGINFSGFGGPFGGSMDFINASNLSFQPGYGSLYFADNGASFGTYTGIAGATVVPEPATLALSGTFGLAGLVALARRRKAIAA